MAARATAAGAGLVWAPNHRSAAFHAGPVVLHRAAAGLCYGSRALLLTRLRASAAPDPQPQSLEAASSSSSSAPPPPELGGQQRRCRGRPPGIPAWNKGLSVPDSTRAKISKAQKRSWRDPEVRQRRVESMLGTAPWNRGVPASEETRRRISEARTGTHHSPKTRRRISKALLGREMPPETAALLSARLTGLTKTPEHRANIAATQRRRHAAARVLRAVEAVYARTGEESASGGAAAAATRLPPAGTLLPGRSAGGQAALVAAFRAQLREYRALQEELSPWTKAFVGKHGRKPTLADVQQTGIAWLVGKYKQYVVLRDRLFSDTWLLRSKLASGGAAGLLEADLSGGFGGGSDSGSLSSSDNGLGLNANGPTPAARGAAANRFAAVMQYKLQRQEAEAAQQAAVANGQSSGAAGAAATAAAAAAAALGTGADASTSTAAAEQQQEPPRGLPRIGPGVPARVRAAMQAAQDYRSKKAAATKAAADAAAAAAQAGFHDVQLSPAAAPAGLDGSSSNGAPALASSRSGAALRPSSGKANGAAVAAARVSRPRTTGALPAEVAAAQAAAHRAAREVQAAEVEVRKALEAPLVEPAHEIDEQSSDEHGHEPAAAPAASAAASS